MTQEQLKELLHYDPETGLFTRTKRTSSNAAAGDIAGTVNKNGYVQIHVLGRLYYAHRLAWLYVHGQFPTDQIDHINRCRTDNRINNLRTATALENQQNISIHRDNRSGVIGVYWYKRTKKWMARIKVKRETIFLGYFDTLEEAAQARAKAKEKYHTFNPRDNNEKAA